MTSSSAGAFATQAIHNKTDLINYMRGLEGKGIISGQYIANNTNYNEIQTIQSNTGKWLGSLGIDYYWYGQTGNSPDISADTNAINWWNNGGLVVLTTHMGTPSLTPSGAPANGGVYDVPGQSNPFTGVIDWNALVTTGTATNAKLNSFLDGIAAGIYDLAKAGVTVIYRPYHESDGGWFWWGTGSGDAVGGANPTSAQFIALWRYTHDYIANKPGPTGQTLGNNIAWAFTGVDQTKGVLNNWPDDAKGQYVDIVGDDIYTNSPGSDANHIARYNAEIATGKVPIVAEFGPSSTPFDETTLISALKTQYPKAVLFQQWDGQNWGIENMQNAQAALSDPYILNRGLAPTTTPIVTPTSNPTPTPVPVPTPTQELTTTSGGNITDSTGNIWTLTSGGIVMENGTAVPGGAGTKAFAIVNNLYYGQDVTSGQWYTYSTISHSWTSASAPTLIPPTSIITIGLRLSEDAYQGDAQFTVSVDGKQVGGTYTASALHSSGDSNLVSLTANLTSSAHKVGIQFLNDAYGGTAATDRNLYVDSIAYNGMTQSGTTAAILSNGTSTFNVGGSTATGKAPADTLTLHLAQDAYNGNAQFTLSIDGKTITTAQDVLSLHSAGAWDTITFAGSFGAGVHKIGVNFTNDSYSGAASMDRNLYVNGIDVNGTHYGSGVTALLSNGTAGYMVTTAG